MTAIIGRSYGVAFQFPHSEPILVSIASRTLHGRPRQSETIGSVYALCIVALLGVFHIIAYAAQCWAILCTPYCNEGKHSDWLAADLRRHVAALLLLKCWHYLVSARHLWLFLSMSIVLLNNHCVFCLQSSVSAARI